MNIMSKDKKSERRIYNRINNKFRSLNEDEIKAISALKERKSLSAGITKFAKVCYVVQDNFTVAIVISGLHQYIGVTKRNKTDPYNPIAGSMIAFVRAIKYNNVTTLKAIGAFNVKSTSDNASNTENVVTDDSDNNHEEISTIKRRRGRPRKNPLSVFTTADIHDLNSVDDSAFELSEDELKMENEVREFELNRMEDRNYGDEHPFL